MSQSDNLLSKLTRLHIEESSFTPEGQKDSVTYNQLVLTYELKGNKRSMRLKINADKAQILEVADTQKNDLGLDSVD